LPSIPHPSVLLEEDRAALYRVDIGATFLTGVEVDIASSLANSTEVGPATRMEDFATVPFKSSRAILRRTGGSFYAIDDVEHGTEIVPRTLATIEESWVLNNCDQTAVPNGWELSSAECDIHDFGVGMIILHWQPSSSSIRSIDDVRQILESLTLASNHAVANLSRRISQACRESLANDPARLDLAHGLDVERVAVLPPSGDVLWLWHIVLVSCESPDHSATADQLASRVCPNDYKILRYRDHTYAAGVHASVACSIRGSELDANFLAKSPRLQDPWWTLFWRLDRVLLALQLSLESSLYNHTHHELQKRADILSEVSSRVDLLRSRMDSFLVSSGARDIGAWEVLADSWDMPYRIGVVDKKMELLGRAYQEAVAKISTSRMTRVNFMIYVFTAFSLVASVVAIAQFTQGVVDERISVRLTIVLVSIMAALAAVALSIRTTRAARSRRNTS
jgi:hypothetical protein